MTAIAAVALVLTVSGAPRTKKTHNQAVLMPSRGKGQPCPHCKKPVLAKVFPSKYWRAWEKAASIDTADREHFWMVKDLPFLAPSDGGPAHKWEPLAHPMNCRALFYRDRLAGDFIGYAQGLADVLEARCIIANDSLLVSWNGSQLLVDRHNPRVELVLEPIPEQELQS